jgi:plastocyanin
MRNKVTFAVGSMAAVSGMAWLATSIITGGMVHADSPRGNENQHKFSNIFLALKPGDQVTFSNQDGVMHRVMSVTPGYDLDVGELQPGASKALVFNRKGVVDLACKMHPEMKMTVFVRTPPKPPGPPTEVVDSKALHTTVNLLSAS